MKHGTDLWSMDTNSDQYQIQLLLLQYQEREQELDTEWRTADLAFENRDGEHGNFGYQCDRLAPSGHDWTERDGECATPAFNFGDGMTEELAQGLNLDQLEDETQRARETKCQWCNLMTLKLYNDCQECNKPLEHNIR